MGINSTGPVLSYNKTPRHTAVSPQYPSDQVYLTSICSSPVASLSLSSACMSFKSPKSPPNIYYLFHFPSYPLSTKFHPQPSHFSRIGPFGGPFRGAPSPLRQPRVRAGKGGGPRRFFFRYIYIQIQISNHKRNSLIHCVV